MLQKSKTAVCAFAVVMFLAGSFSTRALANERCEDRIRRAEERLHQAERRHGDHSRQAEKRRRELEDVRAHCHR